MVCVINSKPAFSITLGDIQKRKSKIMEKVVT